MKVILGHKTKHQVVFVGPFGVGKTTALRSVSDIPVASMETVSEETRQLRDRNKTTTTVGFDYGEWSFADGTRIGLFGVPGQERFNTMWDILLPQSSAVVLWLYGNQTDTLAQGRFWLEALAQREAIARLAVAVTRLPADTPDAELEPYRQMTARYHPLAPVITADPRERDSVMQAIMVALSTPYAPVHA